MPTMPLKKGYLLKPPNRKRQAGARMLLVRDSTPPPASGDTRKRDSITVSPSILLIGIVSRIKSLIIWRCVSLTIGWSENDHPLENRGGVRARVADSGDRRRFTLSKHP